jgi:ABC-2 type transport system ATP-binding protein
MANDQQPLIEAHGVSKYYGDFVAVKDVSFSIPRGQVVAFLGPNGAGKTTTMKILTGFLAPSEGEARIAGYNMGSERLEGARHLGYLPENGPLYDNMTPLELLNFFGDVRGMTSSQLKQRIEAVIDQCALSEVLEKPIGKLSRGYRQRVGVAQALLHDPEVLIMDEPTAGLDPNQIRDFRANIVDLSLTKTVLLSTHILQEVQAVAGRVLFIHEGRLVYDGSPDEMCKDLSMDETFYRLTQGAEAPAQGETTQPDGGNYEDR